MKYKELARKLKVMNCKEISRRGKGSHRKWINQKTGKGSIVPYHGDKDLKIGTVKSVIKQLGIEWEDFEKK